MSLKLYLTLQMQNQQTNNIPEIFIKEEFRKLYDDFVEKFPELDPRDYHDIIEELNTDLFYFNQT